MPFFSFSSSGIGKNSNPFSRKYFGTIFFSVSYSLFKKTEKKTLKWLIKNKDKICCGLTEKKFWHVLFVRSPSFFAYGWGVKQMIARYGQ